jgi:hypothetical protein
LLLIVYFVACHAREERGKEHAERYCELCLALMKALAFLAA